MVQDFSHQQYYLRSDQSFSSAESGHGDQGTYWPQTKCSANSCSSPNKASAICKGSHHSQWALQCYDCKVGFGFICCWNMLKLLISDTKPEPIQFQQVWDVSHSFTEWKMSLKFIKPSWWVPNILRKEMLFVLAWTLTQLTKLHGNKPITLNWLVVSFLSSKEQQWHIAYPSSSLRVL